MDHFKVSYYNYSHSVEQHNNMINFTAEAENHDRGGDKEKLRKKSNFELVILPSSEGHRRYFYAGEKYTCAITVSAFMFIHQYKSQRTDNIDTLTKTFTKKT